MRYEDWKLLATICTVLGIVFFIGGIIAYFYSETRYVFFVPITVYPYQNYTVPLLIVGVSLLVVGIASFSRAEEERKPVSVPLKKCPKCGVKFSPKYEYCPRCGVKLESA